MKYAFAESLFQLLFEMIMFNSRTKRETHLTAHFIIFVNIYFLFIIKFKSIKKYQYTTIEL